MTVEVQDPEIARSKVRELAEAGVDAIKAVYDGAPAFPQLSDEVLAALADEAKANGVPVIVHTIAPAKMLRAMELGVTHFAHVAWQGGFSDDELARPGITGVPVSTSSGIPNRNLANEPRTAALRRLQDAGALIAFGTDISRMDPADALVLEAGDLGAVFSPQEILAALTQNAAAFLGVANRIGTIAVGYDADLVIIDGDPLSDIELLRNVAVVVKGGEIMVERDASP